MELPSQLRTPGLLKGLLHSHNSPRNRGGFTLGFLGFAFPFAFPRLLSPSALETAAEASGTAPGVPPLQHLLCKHQEPPQPPLSSHCLGSWVLALCPSLLAASQGCCRRKGKLSCCLLDLLLLKLSVAHAPCGTSPPALTKQSIKISVPGMGWEGKEELLP